jgi:hypothetical protein
MAGAENGAADAHDGRAFQHRRAHVADMPIDSVSSVDAGLDDAPRPVRAGAQTGRAAVRVLCGSGIAIRPRRRRFGSAATGRASAGSSSGATPLLLASPLMFTCRQMFSGPSLGRALLGQALGDLQALDRVHPVEMVGDRARLVALDRADEMPFQPQVSGRAFATAAILSSLPADSSRRRRAGRRRRLQHRLGWEGLGNGQQAGPSTGPEGRAAAWIVASTACKFGRLWT